MIFIGTQKKIKTTAQKQQFNECNSIELINGKSPTNRDQKSRTYYFYNDMIRLKNFESNLLNIDKKHYKGIDIYYIVCITIKKLVIMRITLLVITLCQY